VVKEIEQELIENELTLFKSIVTPDNDNTSNNSDEDKYFGK